MKKILMQEISSIVKGDDPVNDLLEKEPIFNSQNL
jgi:hypothetical protein